MRLLGGIEAGGTKFVCGVGDREGNIFERERFPTGEPAETVGRAIEFFRRHPEVEAVGIASFGPIDRRTGHIGSTPKPGWTHVDFAGRLSRETGMPTEFDTDVNGAALAEHRWGAAQGIGDFVYITVGTGIGGGALVNGQLAHGHMHPEVGHMRVPHDRERDPYPGSCVFHGDCLEGLACGVAMNQRWSAPAETLPADHPAWHLEAHYLSLGICSIACMLSSELILLGGGVGSNPLLLDMVRTETAKLLNGYIAVPAIRNPGLGDNAGLLGGIALAELALERGSGAV